MNPRLRLITIVCFAIACAGALSAAHAADVFWTTSPGVSDAEVSNVGDQVFGYYFNPITTLPPVVVVNEVPFILQSTAVAPEGLNFNGSYNNPEGIDLYQVPATGDNEGLGQILDSQNWGSEAPLTLSDLTPGESYTVQFMVSDDRPSFLNARNYDVSDGNDPLGDRDVEFAYHSTQGGGVPLAAPPGSVEAKIFTGQFIADSTGTQDIRNWLYEGIDHTGGNSGSQVNAIQLRQNVIPEPAGIILALMGVGLLGLHHWSRKRSRE